MISDKAALSTRVGWIKAEIEALMDQSKQALEAYQSRDRNKESLKECLISLTTIHKTLALSSVKGGETLSVEMIKLIQAMDDESVQDYDAAVEVLAQSFLQLAEYLQHLESGYADLPVVLLPLINELRAARGVELLSEMFVFLPSEDEIDNSHIGQDEIHALQGDVKQAAYKQIRYHFQRALVAWYQGKSVDKSYSNLQRLSNNLIKVHDEIDERKLWWATDALVQALEQKKLEDGVAVKLLLGNMERHIGQLMFSNDDEVLQKERTELNRNILYYIGLADKGAEKVDNVKEAYMLDIYLPQGDNLERMRQHYSSPGQQLWAAVANSLNEDVDVILDGLKTLELNPDPNTCQILTSKGQKVSTTLSMIGMSRLNSIVEKQVKTLEPYERAPDQLTEDVRVNLSTHWIGIKEVLSKYAETGKDTTDLVFSDDDAVNAGGNEAITEVYHTVHEELSNTLNSINHFEKDKDINHLSLARGSLTSVKSTMTFMANKEISPLVDGAITYLDKIIVSGEPDVNTNELVILADILMVLESATTALQEQEDHTVLLEKGYQSLEQLDKLSSLDGNLAEELSDAREMAQVIKKQMRQSRMQTMLAV